MSHPDDRSGNLPGVPFVQSGPAQTAPTMQDAMRESEWLEDELMEVMRIVSPGMGSAMPDNITFAIMVTAIRRLMEADTDRYEALLERWQQRHSREPQNCDRSEK